MDRLTILQELAEARREYCRLLEAEKHADPVYVDVVVLQIMAQTKRLEALRRELEAAG